MYNRIFKADYLLYNMGCSVETVAFLEIVLKHFEKANLPVTESFLGNERKFKVEDIFDEVFDKDVDGRFSSIKFPNSYKDDAELIEKLEAMFSDDKNGIRGKNLDELLTAHEGYYGSDIKVMNDLFQIVIVGIVQVLSRQPYGFRVYYRNIDGVPYFVVGSWANPGACGK